MEKDGLFRVLRNGLDSSLDTDISTISLEDRKKLAAEFYGEFKNELSRSFLMARLGFCGLDALVGCMEDNTIPASFISPDHPERVVDDCRNLHESLMESRRRKSNS